MNNMSRDFKKKKRVMLSFSPLLDLEECSLTARHDECANIKDCASFFFLSLFSVVIWHHHSYQLHRHVTFGQLCRCSCDDYTTSDQNPASFQLCLHSQTPSKCNNKKKRDNASRQIFFFYQHQKKASLAPVLQAFLFSKSYCQALKSSLRFTLACPFSPVTLFLSFLRNILLGPFTSVMISIEDNEPLVPILSNIPRQHSSVGLKASSSRQSKVTALIV